MTTTPNDMSQFAANMPEPWTEDDPLFDKTYWNRPESSPDDRGDDTIGPIYTAVGFALSQWETAEVMLADLFLTVCECENSSSYNPVRRAFGSFESSGGRRKALEEAAAVYFGHYWGDPLTKPFKKLLLAFERASFRRNEIAHGRAQDVTVNSTPLGAFLFPASYNTGRNSLFPGSFDESNLFSVLTGEYRYTSATIVGFGNKFWELAKKLNEYRHAARKVNGTPGHVLAAQLREREKLTASGHANP
ncbi:hypothetical protein [Paraburkholderia sp. GAS82]|uniref:hypothetical protein n=1 Tax=Paraburkholderia sp. GAS82 TaxID=3035137 RepID=UPI003D250427